MPKKIRFESFKYRFLIAAQQFQHFSAPDESPRWNDFVRSLTFSYGKGAATISWPGALPDAMVVPLDEPRFYLRGDTDQHVARQMESALSETEDPIKLDNEAYFRDLVTRVARSAGYAASASQRSEDQGRVGKERAFHDAWAGSEDIGSIDVRAANEACTAPEMRFIVHRLGDLRGKRLLDIGCGLGEASVYFALRGAEVTSSDLSQGMLDATCQLAHAYHVNVTPHLAAAEDLRLPSDARFDVIYAGNLLHHVDVDQTLSVIARHLAPGGKVVTWDPLAYNPLINVYRAIATDVRTPDEHPLTRRDLQLFRKHFGVVETSYFWLTTLLIFVTMAVVQRRNPNKERFWKVVVKEGHKWQWLYSPLEKLDRLLLRFLPPLRPLCWNVVVVSSNPIGTRA